MMSNQERCREIEGMIPAFVLGALDSGEQSLVTAHLAHCQNCRALEGEYQAVAEGLLHAPAAQSPPARLRSQIAGAVEAPGIPLSQRIGTRLRGPTALRLAAGLALLLLVAVNLLLLARLDTMVQQQQRLQVQVDRNQTAMAVLTYPTSKVVEIEGESIFGTLVYDPSRRVAVLYAWGLEGLPSDQEYQAWLQQDSGARVSAGLFQAEPGGAFSIVILDSPAPIEEYVGFGVTVEPRGGSPGPTGEPVLTADL